MAVTAVKSEMSVTETSSDLSDKKDLTLDLEEEEEVEEERSWRH